MAYSSQTPFIQNMSLRKNIFFGEEIPTCVITDENKGKTKKNRKSEQSTNRNAKSESREKPDDGAMTEKERREIRRIWRRYKRSLESASLIPDLKTLPRSDLTEIGERGINLSGNP